MIPALDGGDVQDPLPQDRKEDPMPSAISREPDRAASVGRLCRHTLEGRTQMPKRCLLNGACYCCAFDQWLEAMEAEKTPRGERIWRKVA
jgi:hypothetical protein